MASKESAPTGDELLKQFDDLGVDDAAPAATATLTVTATATASKDQGATATEADDLLAELENLGADKPPSSRPHTPRVGIKKTGTPPGSSSRTSEDKGLRTSEDKNLIVRKSGESSRSFHTSFTPPSAAGSDSQDAEKSETVAQAAQPAPEKAAVSSGNSWWGGLSGVMSVAAKAAENVVEKLQENEEAKRWAEQAKGGVGIIRGFGGELSSRALPTFTNILHTLAPPISSHERLQIHATHDFINYPSLSPLIHTIFARVMAQVEGGDLIVIQRGQESGVRRAFDAGQSSSGWSDGPWWRHNENRDIGAIKGLIEGTKLVRASAEAYATDYFDKNGGLEAASQRATEDMSESNPVRSSDIFIAVQAIQYDATADLFQGPPKDTKEDTVVEEEKADELIAFAIYLHDPVHSISYHTLTQPIPSRWIRWLDASSALTPTSSSHSSEKLIKSGGGGFFGGQDEVSNEGFEVPEEIKEIIESGGIDPREWVAEWVEETLSLGVGILAQRYVARRMGVGEGGIGRGKARMEEVIGDGGGEVARAGLI